MASRSIVGGSLLVLLSVGSWACDDEVATSSSGSTGTTSSGGGGAGGGAAGTTTNSSTATTSTSASNSTGGAGVCVVHVRPTGGDDASDGATWGTSKATLQGAIAEASVHGCDVWAMTGTYLPTNTADRTATFALAPNIAVYGGFLGNETTLDARDPAVFVTTLSGDIGISNDASDNSYHVVVGANGARLDGFTVTLGRTDAKAPKPSGAGLLAENVTMTVANCKFADNRTGNGELLAGAGSAGPPGGGIFQSGGELTVTDCLFTSNQTGDGGGSLNVGGAGGGGGAIAAMGGAVLHLIRPLFSANRTGRGGTATGSNSVGGPGGSGAGLYLDHATADADAPNFDANVTGDGGNGVTVGGNSGSGGGAFVGPMASWVVKGGQFTSNRTGKAGSANSTGAVAGNAGDGAGIGVSQGTLDVDQSTFAQNQTGDGSFGTSIGGYGGSGGGIGANQATGVTITASTFTNNATGIGGSSTSLGGLGGSGAGVYLNYGAGPVIVRGASFVNNVCGTGGSGNLAGHRGDGGGLRWNSGTVDELSVAQSTFTGNHAWEGGALAIGAFSGTGDVQVVDVVAASNQADSGGGGLAFRSKSERPFTLAHSSFTLNQAGSAGGAIEYVALDATVAPGGLRVVNTILFGDLAPTAAEVHGTKGPNAVAPLTFDHVDLGTACPTVPAGIFVCTSLVNVDPGFANAGGGDLRVAVSSPIVGLGDPALSPADRSDLDNDGDLLEATPVDLDGKPRVGGGGLDLGAYEAP